MFDLSDCAGLCFARNWYLKSFTVVTEIVWDPIVIDFCTSHEKLTKFSSLNDLYKYFKLETSHFSKLTTSVYVFSSAGWAYSITVDLCVCVCVLTMVIQITAGCRDLYRRRGYRHSAQMPAERHGHGLLTVQCRLLIVAMLLSSIGTSYILMRITWVFRTSYFFRVFI